MNRASVILKNAREDKSLELSEVSKKLKVPVHYLLAIESEVIANFPSEPYCSLIIKDYANYLGLNGSDILSLFRRDFANPVKSKTDTSPKLAVTPQSIFKYAIVFSVIFFLYYIISEYLKFNRPPSLLVNWPDENSISASSTFEISGVTDPEATVRINNDLIIIDPSGKFHKNLSLQKDDLKVLVESKSHNGKTTTVEKTYHPK